MDIQSIRARAKTWQVEESSFYRLPAQSKQRMLGCIISDSDRRLREGRCADLTLMYESSRSVKGQPAASGRADLRSSGYVTPIRDQGKCGACVAFGTIAAVEATYKMQEKDAHTDIDLSEADLFFCSDSFASCGRGWTIEPALTAMQTRGTVDEEVYPYEGMEQACMISDSRPQVTQITDYEALNSIEEMEAWLDEKGALVASFHVYEDFYLYSKGIYSYVKGEFLGGHAIAIVGYDSTQEFWICKNSWGDDWGESGFFRIAYGQCGIEADVYAVTGVEVGGQKRDPLAQEFAQVSDRSRRDTGGRIRGGSWWKNGESRSARSPSTAVANRPSDRESRRLTHYLPISQRGSFYFQTEADLQDYCLQVLESKGFSPQSEVWVSEGLRADIVCDRTIYELKKVLTRDTLYQAFGQGTAYLAASGLNRLVIVGQLPTGSAKEVARSTARHLEQVNRKLAISFVEHDPFWEIENPRGFGFQRWRLVFSAVGAVLLTLTAKDALLIVWRWMTVMPIEMLFRVVLSIAVVLLIFSLGLRRRTAPKWEQSRR